MMMPPSPHQKSWMAFVDGENLTIRGQEVAQQKGLKLTTGKYWERDIFLWKLQTRVNDSGRVRFVNPAFPELQGSAVRSYYYTSVAGDSEKLRRIENSLWDLGFTARVFKKEQQKNKAKAVDIALTTDMLSHAFGNHYDSAVLVTGDGDFLPVVEQVKRTGKTVILAAFANGLNKDLRVAADVDVDLTDPFFVWWEDTTKKNPGSLT
jgi:uncharacterized LabA/DUF88 family protein